MMWHRLVSITVMLYYWLSVVLAVLISLWLVLGVPNYLSIFADNVTLPNGMVLRRQFDFTLSGRDDLFAPDGKMRLVRGVDMICFDDRFALVWAVTRDTGGIFDAATPSGRPVSATEGVRAEWSLSGREGCNGYYTGMLGAEFLYDGNNRPFLPPCSWRNFSNPALKHKDWLLPRPCDPRDFGAASGATGTANFP